MDLGARVAGVRRGERGVELVDVPGGGDALAAQVQEPRSEVDEGTCRLPDPHGVAPPGAAEAELGARVVQGDQPEVGCPVRQVAAAVVQHEEEPTSERRQPGCRAQQPVQRGADRSEVDPAAAETGRGRGHHVAGQLVAAAGQQPGRLDRAHHPLRQSSGLVGEPAQLQVGARGEVEVTVPVLLRDPREGAEGGGRDLPADEPDPDQRAVLGRPGAQHPGAEVAARPGSREVGPGGGGCFGKHDVLGGSGWYASPSFASRGPPQGPAGLRTRDPPARSAFPGRLDPVTAGHGGAGRARSAPPVTHTAARQSRTRTGFPRDWRCEATNPMWSQLWQCQARSDVTTRRTSAHGRAPANGREARFMYKNYLATMVNSVDTVLDSV